MILHFFLNSLLVFLVLALFVELFLYAFRVKDPRTRCACRSLPIIKLPVDMVIYVILGFADSFFINLNPFSCEVYLQKLILSLLPSDIKHDLSVIERVIVPEYISTQIPAIGLQACIALFFIMSSFLIIRKACRIIGTKTQMKKIFDLSSPCKREVLNLRLREALANQNAVVLTTSELKVPIAAYRRFILIPALFEETFSQEEFDAVIAHELEHLRWKDPILKLFFNGISTLFWWVPTVWWLRKLEADQEEASDSGLLRYGIDSLSLATALMKVVNKAKSSDFKYELAPTCGLNSSKSVHVNRFESLLNVDASKNRNAFRLRECVGSVLCVFICICFWMC